MILGNSFGRNRGKKYVMRGKHHNVPAKGGEAKAEKFKEWFEATYPSLLTEIHDKDLYDCDIINETYIRMYEYILYSGADVDNYRSYFMRSHFTNIIQRKVQNNRYVPIADTYDALDTKGYDHELEMKQRKLEDDIFMYVYNRYKVREFELFKMYICLKPAVNYESLSVITNLKVHQIQAVVSKIKKDICRNNEFVNRRKEALA